ncbi:hypothetical protein BDV26DRAFT_287999 [Aspergillus bertholletiae]|uniref:Uncharacterized protein n=1 Tax=Aspergillus bertholletiae TaxID=1226010 RepID=A0A5N7BMG1_9EURO|nr:hypothetical protein BDV26DRAFT_287999 [Aspergillus bertholletiae]
MSLCLQLVLPLILPMEVCSKDDRETGILIQGRVRYLTIACGTYDRPTLPMPLNSLPDLPRTDAWNRAHISRDSSIGGKLKSELCNTALPSVQDIWHPESFDCLEIERVRQITVATFEATCQGSMVIAKIARFQWEIPRLSQESRIYKNLENTGLALRFLAMFMSIVA